jgi:hypothetical protein
LKFFGKLPQHDTVPFVLISPYFSLALKNFRFVGFVMQPEISLPYPQPAWQEIEFFL